MMSDLLPVATAGRSVAPLAASPNPNKPTAPTKPTADPKKEDPAPVVYLKTLLSSSELGQKAMKRPLRASFSKPSQEALDAYDLDVVKAVRDRDLVKLRSLIEEGRSMDACNRFGESLVHMACRRGDEATVRLLIFEGNVKIDVTDDFGRTCLHDACWTTKPNFSVFDLLLKVCSIEQLMAEDVRGHTPFHYARKEHWDVWVEYLRGRSELILGKLS